MLIVILLTLPVHGWAQEAPHPPESLPMTTEVGEGPADEGALFLLLPVGAQAVGVGRAMTARSTQEAAFWNPAGLGGLASTRVLVYRGDHLVGDATAVSALIARPALGTLGLSYQLLDVGSQDLTDGQGNVMGSVSVRSHQAILSVATRLSAQIDLGANIKYVRFGLSCRGQCPEASMAASTFAVDLGGQFIPVRSVPLRFGAMVAHLGPRLQVVNAERADPLPTRVRVSVAYDLLEQFLPDEDLGFSIMVEMEERWNGDRGDPSLYMGSELRVGEDDRVFLRGGYILGGTTQTDAAALGFGVRYERFELGMARSLARTNLAAASEPVHVTLGISF